MIRLFPSLQVRLAALRSWFSRRPLSSWPLLLAMRVTGRELVRTGHCRCCSACCRQINLQIGGDWLKRTSQFEELAATEPRYRRFFITGKDQHGLLLFQCRLLGTDGTCQDYHNRLDLCRSFPTSSLILCGGTLPRSCGYAIGPAVPFERRLKQARKRHEI